jgi:hypothetical protein
VLPKSYFDSIRHLDPVPGALLVNRTYRVSIPYERSTEQLLEMGHYDITSPYLNDLDFQRTVCGRDRMFEIEMVHFGRNISTDDALAGIEQQGLRPSNVTELLAFGASYPDVQREFPVVALGEIFPYPHGARNVVALGTLGELRCVFVWLAVDWYDACRFAAIWK